MAATIEDLHPDLLIHTLRRLAGPDLAAATSSTAHLRSIATVHHLWRDLCLATWPSLNLLPSLPISHHSFFADAYPFPSPPASIATVDLPAKLISTVDLYHRGAPILSRVVETDASTPWSLTSPFRIDCLDHDSPAVTVSPGELSLSWVVIDPVRHRAVNVSSRVPLAMDRHWYTGDTLVRFATVVGDCVVGAVVTCGEEGHVREVSLTVEDMDGICLNGRDSLGILKGMMEAGRRVKGGEVEAGKRYAEHVTGRRLRKERKMRQEGMLDLCCTVVGAALFVGFLMCLVFR